MPRSQITVLSLLAALFAYAAAATGADDAEVVKDKLFQAKKAYDLEVEKYRKSVGEWLDKREDAGRQAGNKKAVDLVKAEREAFEKCGDPPPTLSTGIRDAANMARHRLDKEYSAAVKGYLLLKLDEEAGKTEKEQLDFQVKAAVAFGRRTFLASLSYTDLHVPSPPAAWFRADGHDAVFGKQLFKDGQPIPHSIYLAPPANGTSEVTYLVKTNKVAFRAVVGITPVGDDAHDPRTPVVFEVLGDGKSLWKSKPVAKLDVYETGELRVDKVKRLTLRVNCPGPHDWARAVWYEPILAE